MFDSPYRLLLLAYAAFLGTVVLANLIALLLARTFKWLIRRHAN